ncbi:MAG: hypothetical protein II419_07390, partial [Acidaminococcaceae bacterium]|nr:hypothetical protein [Acidaminococcaceae bacterium]
RKVNTRFSVSFLPDELNGIAVCIANHTAVPFSLFIGPKTFLIYSSFIPTFPLISLLFSTGLNSWYNRI